jgi:NitT/TauT family transport system substrate-binding protein
MSHRGGRILAALVAALALAVVAGCGSSGDSSTSASTSSGGTGTASEELTTINVGSIPVANQAPLFLGVKKGFFADEGLKLNISSSLSGAPQNVPRLLKGDLQVVSTAWMSLLLAKAQNLPVVAIAPGDNAGETPDQDYCHVLTTKDSGITELSALKGKTIAVNTVKNVGELSMDAVLKGAGVDPTSVKYVQLPWPEMGSALRNGRIAAGWVCEPFLTQDLQEMQVNDLGASQNVAVPRFPVSVYITSQEYLKSNPDAIKRFQAAVAKSNAYAQAHLDEARAIIPTYTDISADVVKKMILPTWSTSYDTEAIQGVADRAAEFKLVPEKIDVSTIMAPFNPGSGQ